MTAFRVSTDVIIAEISAVRTHKLPSALAVPPPACMFASTPLPGRPGSFLTDDRVPCLQSQLISTGTKVRTSKEAIDPDLHCVTKVPPLDVEIFLSRLTSQVL